MATFRTSTVRVLVDEAHQQAWTTRAGLAEQMMPGHPGDSSYVAAAAALRMHDFGVEVHAEGLLTPDALQSVDVLVLPHMSESKYESTTGVGSPVYTPEEIAAISDFVAAVAVWSC